MQSAMFALLQRIHGAATALACGALVALWPLAAWAAPTRRGAAEPPKEPTYFWTYAGIVFVLAIGLAVICRPSYRKEYKEE
jgi:hypothetical protein